tara:strand:+ start:734 stop:913 length:180 start_codon:yes stop_codon:yes gene_type:complete
MDDALDHECICSCEEENSEQCICKAEDGCDCQGCGCDDEQKAQCDCGNWQQCAIEEQDN